MIVRRAQNKDIKRINDLLFQVAKIHADGRPDIFKENTKKYTDEELISIIKDDKTPVFVAVDEDNMVQGYTFCIHNEIKDDLLLCNMKSLYIDDLCVDENCRGKHIGSLLYEYVVRYAKECGCSQLTLNVWCLNESAMRFYKKCGLEPLKVVMEQKL